MRSLASILLSPAGLAPATARVEALRAAVVGAAGPKGIVEDLTHPGDPREPAALHALFASPGAPSRRGTVLFVHGKGGCSAEWRPDAARALRAGWNVLVPDLRGHPPSEGARVTYGAREAVDLDLLLEHAGARFGVRPETTALDGCSMGALVALRLAARHAGFAALWLQAPFGNLYEMGAIYVARATGLPVQTLRLPTRLATARIESQTGIELSDLDPVATARRVTTPTVVIHGESDVLVPQRLARAVFDALAGEKEFWSVPRAGHCHHPDEPQAIFAREYAARWTAFLSRHLG